MSTGFIITIFPVGVMMRNTRGSFFFFVMRKEGNGRESFPAIGERDILRRFLHAESDGFRADLHVPPFDRRDGGGGGGSVRVDRTGREGGSRGTIQSCGNVPEGRGCPEGYRRGRAMVPPGGGAGRCGCPVRTREDVSGRGGGPEKRRLGGEMVSQGRGAGCCGSADEPGVDEGERAGCPPGLRRSREMVQEGRGAGGRKSAARTRHHVSQRLRCGSG